MKNIFSVERLDYSKGYRSASAYETLLDKYPQHHGKIRYTQIAPTSRGEVQAYQDIRHQLETEAGRINGRYGQLGWTPLFYLNQHFDRKILMKVFRYADVGLVTPLRDGMNGGKGVCGGTRSSRSGGAGAFSVCGSRERTHFSAHR